EVPPKRGGGCYYSFALDDSDYNREPDLEYAGNQLSTGFYGNSTGHVLNLGPIPLAMVTPAAPPAGLAPETAALYTALTSFETKQTAGFNTYFEFGCLIGAGYRRGTAVVQGDTYLLRAILPDEHDLLAAFTVTEVVPGS